MVHIFWKIYSSLIDVQHPLLMLVESFLDTSTFTRLPDVKV
jgi:hypothetical protein